MKKLIITLILLIAIPCFAADVTLDWDAAPGATGYKIQMSTDMGVTWSVPIDAGTTKPYIYTGVPEDRIVMFRVAAYNAAVDVWNYFAGVWYDHRQRLLCPSGVRSN